MTSAGENPLRTRFVVPQELFGPPTKSSRRPRSRPNSSAPLVRLPNEIVLEIFSLVEHEDQLWLALTCKRLLQVSACVSIEIPSAVKHQFRPYCSNMHNFLKRVAPQDARGRPKKTVALCHDCLRYRPTRKTYWRGKKHEKCEESEQGLPGWERAVEHWRDRFSTQCPQCWCDEWVALDYGSQAEHLKGRYDWRVVDDCPCRA
ncbi:hypothetical protein ACJZ2D_007118 [Fusarium nematophilum]